MWLKLLRMRTVMIVIVVVVGIALGTLFIDNAISDTYSNQNLAPAPVYPRNENGQTYGSALYATSPYTEPELIKAYGVDGTLGYVRSVDLEEGLPNTPEEALAQQRNRASKVRQIPLYDVDGKTVIGVFDIEDGNGTEIQAEKKN